MTTKPRAFQNRAIRSSLAWRHGTLIDDGADIEFADGRRLSGILRDLAREVDCANADIELTVQARVTPRRELEAMSDAS